MYPDSNWVGLFIACTICFIIGMKPNDRLYFTKYLIPLGILLLGTLSRASIISTLLVISLKITENFKYRKYIIFFSSAVLVAMISLRLSNDDSLLSKLWIAGLTFNYIMDAGLIDIFIGVGPGNAESVLGIGSHLLPLTLIIETGIFGTILFILMWRSILKLGGTSATPILLVFFTTGLSFTTFATPWFYTMVSILIFLNNTPNHARAPTRIRFNTGI